MSVRIIERFPDGREIHTPAVFISAAVCERAYQRRLAWFARGKWYRGWRDVEARDDADGR